LKIGQYHRDWQKAVNILKQYGHLLFAGQEIHEGGRGEKLKVMYERLMSTLIYLRCCLFFFCTIKGSKGHGA
jgi:hypothetical protein